MKGENDLNLPEKVQVSISVDEKLYHAYKIVLLHERTNTTNDIRKYMDSRVKNAKINSNLD
jgi:hypothetical protein